MVRGIRNKNIGNIIYNSANSWLGQVGHDKDGFVIFDSYYSGVRAMAHLLHRYYVRGYNTVAGVVRRYSATDQDSYIGYVCTFLGVQPLSLLRKSDLPRLVLAMASFECGRFDDKYAQNILVMASFALASQKSFDSSVIKRLELE